MYVFHSQEIFSPSKRACVEPGHEYDTTSTDDWAPQTSACTYTSSGAPNAWSDPVDTREKAARQEASEESETCIMKNLILLVETLSKIRSGNLPLPVTVKKIQGEKFRGPGAGSSGSTRFSDTEHKRSHSKSSLSFSDESSSKGRKRAKIDTSVKEQQKKNVGVEEGKMPRVGPSRHSTLLILLARLSSKIITRVSTTSEFQNVASTCGLDAVIVFKRESDIKEVTMTCSLFLNSLLIATGNGTSYHIAWQDCYRKTFTLFKSKSPQEILKSHEQFLDLSKFRADADLIESKNLYMSTNRSFIKQYGDKKSRALSDLIIIEKTGTDNPGLVLTSSAKYSKMLLKIETRPFKGGYR